MKKVCLLLVLLILASLLPVATTAYADSYKTLELDTTCSIELPSGCTYWRSSGGYKYYKYGSFIVSVEVMSSKLNLSSEIREYKSLGYAADYDYSKTGVRCAYGLNIESSTEAYGFVAFNSKSHGIRLLVGFNAYSSSQSNYYLHIIDSIKVYNSEPDNKGKNGWKKEGNNWRYYVNDTACTGWKKISGSWYYFDASGNMSTGWVRNSGSWYYFSSDGTMATGWKKIGSSWYYFSPAGIMATGWLRNSGSWYYFSSDGTMVTGWKKLSDGWHYFDGGAMVTGWKQIGGKWYFFKGGVIVTGWFEDKDTEWKTGQKNLWYWFDDQGIMAAGWKKIDGSWEYFDNSGVWQYTWDGK